MLRASIITTLLCLSFLSQNSVATCVDYVVNAGDDSNSISNSVCGSGSGCAAGGYPHVLKGSTKCPTGLSAGETVQVCCNDCYDHVVQSGDNSWLLTKDCAPPSWEGCAEGSTTAPTMTQVRNGVTEYCPSIIYTGSTVQVCCNGIVDVPDSPGPNPTPAPTPAPTPSTPSTPSPSPSTSTPPPSTGTCPSLRTVGSLDTIYFTIDDGPSLGSRAFILDALQEINAKASFFESGYNFCKDGVDVSGKAACWGSDGTVNTNTFNLGRTVKEGHFIASHSDFHYYSPVSGQCEYEDPVYGPYVRPQWRVSECGTDAIQDMVQGAYEVTEALNNVDWTTDEERALRDRANETMWTYARLPCSDIWRTTPENGGLNISRTWDPSATEVAKRLEIADNMFNGNVKCRPAPFSDMPWETYGFDADVEFRASHVNTAKCDFVAMLENHLNNNPGKNYIMLLTHDYIFDSPTKAELFASIMEEMRAKGYNLDTVDNFPPTA